MNSVIKIKILNGSCRSPYCSTLGLKVGVRISWALCCACENESETKETIDAETINTGSISVLDSQINRFQINLLFFTVSQQTEER